MKILFVIEQRYFIIERDIFIEKKFLRGRHEDTCITLWREVFLYKENERYLVPEIYLCKFSYIATDPTYFERGLWPTMVAFSHQGGGGGWGVPT